MDNLSNIDGQPIVNQIEEWARTNTITLTDGWKVELSRSIQNKFDKIFENIDESIEQTWVALFNKFLNEN